MENDYDPSPSGGPPRLRKGERGMSIRSPSGYRAAAPNDPDAAAQGALRNPLRKAPPVDSCGVTVERLRHEQEHAWYNELYLLAPVGYFLVGLDCCILQVNLVGADLLGISRAQCRAHRFRHFVSPSYLGDYERFIELAFNSQAPEKCMLELRGDGTPIPVTLFASADGSGQACRIVVERAEGKLQALERNEERFRRIVHTAQEGIWEIDAQACTTFVNPKMAAMLGYSIEEMLGQPLAAFMDAEARLIMERNVANRQLGLAERHEFRFLRRDGQGVWTSLASNPIYNSAGSYIGALALVTDIGERKQAVELHWQRTNFDGLTGLPNRHMFMDRLALEIRKADRRADFLALLLIDLDHFKEINMRHGHAVGDAILVEAARRTAACVRATDTLARLGGDEFAVALSGLDHAGNVERIAQDIIGALARPFELGGQTVFMSASIGIALYPPDASGVDALLEAAGHAVGASKASGRNRFTHARPDLQQAAIGRQTMAADLRLALASGQFEVFYQPIVALDTGVVHKAEALLRWHHPLRGTLSPAEFIPFAESSGQIVEIGNWVFRQVAEQVKAWQRSIDPSFQISINKSPVQFRRDANAHLDALACLQELGLPANSIVIEITEALLLDGAGAALDQLRSFRAMGVQVALDDFGTGYCSLSHLKRFAIDVVKIDQSFVATLEDDAGDLALCEAIILMAHKLGLKVVAEGVETKVQRALLVDAGCDYAQGYIFAHPMTADELEVLASVPGATLPH